MEDFFDELDVTAKKNAGEFSDEGEDVEKKIASFENNDSDDAVNDELEPEFLLPPDHTAVKYPEYKRINWTGPFNEWKDLPLPITVIDILEKSYKRPTDVQLKGIPEVLKGTDTIVIAPTGSGKTIGFLIPLIVHCSINPSDDIVGIIISPTDILCEQTNTVAKSLGMSTVCLVGSQLKYKQKHQLNKGRNIVIATPGRLITFLKDSEWSHCSFVVVDECDRIYEMGFIRQLRSIFNFLRPDRQTVLFGATLPTEIAVLCKSSLNNPSIIELDSSKDTITHEFKLFESTSQKLDFLKEFIASTTDQCLIFVNTRAFAERIHTVINDPKIGMIHGQLQKAQRDKEIALFKNRKHQCLICTDIAARGIDIQGVKCIINYDTPETSESYIHRVGRTGRAGESGTAITLVTARDKDSISAITAGFIQRNYTIPPSLQELISH